VSICPYFK